MSEAELMIPTLLRSPQQQVPLINRVKPGQSVPTPALPFGWDFPELETERIRLRELIPADARDLFAIHGDPAVMRWFGNEALSDIRSAQRLIDFFAHCRQSATGTRWALERKEDGRLLGTCGFYTWDRNYRRCNIGYELGVFAWGRGYMQEALSAILAWGFSNMHLHRIEAYIHPENTASIRLAQGFGFVEEGLLRELEFWGGRYHDMLLFSLLHQSHNKQGQSRSAAPRKGAWYGATFNLARIFMGRR